MGRIRLYVKTVRITLWCLLLYPYWLFERWRLRRDPTAVRARRRHLFRIWARGIARIIGLEIQHEGPLPEAPAYVVTNHLSYVDVFVYASLLGPVFVARGDVQHWPVIGKMMQNVQMLFIDRDRARDTVRVNEAIATILEERDIVLVFAESRITRGLDVAPFKSALLQPAVAAQQPVHHATITYRTRPGARPPAETIAWWRPESWPTHASRVLRNRGAIAHVQFGAEPMFDADRKVLGEQLWRASRAAYVPLE